MMALTSPQLVARTREGRSSLLGATLRTPEGSIRGRKLCDKLVHKTRLAVVKHQINITDTKHTYTFAQQISSSICLSELVLVAYMKTFSHFAYKISQMRCTNILTPWQEQIIQVRYSIINSLELVIYYKLINMNTINEKHRPNRKSNLKETL